jgi:pyruvate/2-oxoglutarate dehydrogenase complex dihydrolipoamide acyltransferase (E2) component
MDVRRLPIQVPDLGLEEDAELIVSLWFAQPGEMVLEGERLVEILAGDTTFDVTAPVTGRLLAIEREEEEQVEPGDVLGWMEATETDNTVATD